MTDNAKAPESNYRVERLKTNATHQAKCYFVASTAPRNVEDDHEPIVTPDNRECIDDFGAALKEIATYLKQAENPRLIVRLHGYNTPTPNYDDCFSIIQEHCNEDGVVFIGYQWPSEQIGETSKSFLSSAPLSLYGIMGISAGFFAFGTMLVAHQKTRAAGLLTWLGGGAVAAIPWASFLLRTSVYFRDIYRSQAFGVTDLLEMIRQLHRALLADDSNGQVDWSTRSRVGLSFIAHSMGSLVTTTLIRILTDVFDDRQMNRDPDDGSKSMELPNTVGQAYQLQRLVMASPDITAETLMTKRANYLAPSLNRFDESYLFSNRNDGVLKKISTLANSFSFPTKSSRYGFRLGNTEVVSKSGVYGIIPPDLNDFANSLRIDRMTLSELSADIKGQTTRKIREGFWENATPSTVAERFTYFDCSDYVETDATGTVQHPMKKSEHGGYFEGAFTNQLIHQFACLGGAETLRRNNLATHDLLSVATAKRHIRVLLSPNRPADMLSDALPATKKG